jgi:hypothetical protein
MRSAPLLKPFVWSGRDVRSPSGNPPKIFHSSAMTRAALGGPNIGSWGSEVVLFSFA